MKSLEAGLEAVEFDVITRPNEFFRFGFQKKAFQLLVMEGMMEISKTMAYLRNSFMIGILKN